MMNTLNWFHEIIHLFNVFKWIENKYFEFLQHQKIRGVSNPNRNKSKPRNGKSMAVTVFVFVFCVFSGLWLFNNILNDDMKYDKL